MPLETILEGPDSRSRVQDSNSYIMMLLCTVTASVIAIGEYT